MRISPPDGGSPVFVEPDLTAELVSKGVPLQGMSAGGSTTDLPMASAESDKEQGEHRAADEEASTSEKAPLLGKQMSGSQENSVSQVIFLCGPKILLL